MIRNRFFKETLGIHAELIIAKSLDASNSTAAQTTFQGFVDNAVAGALYAYWEDTKAVVGSGATATAANAGRKFFYAYKMSDGTVKVSTPIPAPCKYRSTAFSAGTSDTWTIVVAGTLSVGQTLTIRIKDVTGGMIPYPEYIYEVPYNTSNNQTAADIVTAINAELDEKILTASASTNTVTIVASDKTRNIKVIQPVVQTTVAAPTDASAIVVAQTVKGTLPLGTTADVLEFERLYNINTGGTEYTPEGTKPSEFGVLASNVATGINYGYLVVTATRTERGEGSVHGVSKTMTTIVAIATAALSTLAGL